MITLEQLVRDQKWSQLTDIQIIKTFFDLNDLEEEAMDMINDLGKRKIEKLKSKNRMVREWASYLPSKYLYENYDLEIADRLHMLELDYLVNGDELSEKRLEWAKENIPNIEEPKIYFMPLMEWLDIRDIRFKGAKPMKDRMFIQKREE